MCEITSERASEQVDKFGRKNLRFFLLLLHLFAEYNRTFTYTQNYTHTHTHKDNELIKYSHAATSTRIQSEYLPAAAAAAQVSCLSVRKVGKKLSYFLPTLIALVPLNCRHARALIAHLTRCKLCVHVHVFEVTTQLTTSGALKSVQFVLTW